MARAPAERRLELVALTVTMTIAAAASGLVFASPYAPLLVVAAVVAVGATIVCVQQPIWALYAALLVVLLPTGLLPASLHSNLNRASAVYAFVVWLAWTLAGRGRVRLTGPAWLMFGFVAWGVIALGWTRDVTAAWTGIQTYVLRLMVYLGLIANEVRTRRDVDGLMTALALIGWAYVLLSLYSVLQNGYVPGTRLEVLDANENTIGILALVALPGVLWQISGTSRRAKRVWSVLGLVYLASALLLTVLSGSRGSTISFLIALVAFVLWKPTRAWARFGLVFLLLAGLCFPVAFSTTLARFLLTGTHDTVLGGREALWQAGWQLIQDHLWLGVGIRNAPIGVLPYLQKYVSVGQANDAALHNPVLTIWAETGIPGLLLYLAVLGSAAWLFVRKWLSHRRQGGHWLAPYFALVSSVFMGYIASWIKGGGMEDDFSYFLVLALLILPSHLEGEWPDETVRADPQVPGLVTGGNTL